MESQAKQEEKAIKKVEKAFKQHHDDRRDMVTEYLLSGLYQLALYDRAPKNELVSKDGVVIEFKGNAMTRKADSAQEIYLRSKFFDNFQTVGEFTGGQGYNIKKTKKLAQLEGMEKVLASCLLFGEVDYHAGNTGVVSTKDEQGKDKFTAVKIDHGRSGQNFFSAPRKLRADLLDNLKEDYNFKRGHLKIEATKMKAAIDEMLKIDEAQIDQQIGAKCDNLRHLGLDLNGIEFVYYVDDEKKIFQVEPYDQSKHGTEDKYREKCYADLAKHFKERILQQREVLRGFAIELDIIEKLSPSDHAFKEGGWLREIKGKDIIVWAIDNDKKIEGKDPLAWAVDNDKKIKGKDPLAWAVDNNKNFALANSFLTKLEKPSSDSNREYNLKVVEKLQVKAREKGHKPNATIMKRIAMVKEAISPRIEPLQKQEPSVAQREISRPSRKDSFVAREKARRTQTTEVTLRK